MRMRGVELLSVRATDLYRERFGGGAARECGHHRRAGHRPGQESDRGTPVRGAGLLSVERAKSGGERDLGPVLDRRARLLRHTGRDQGLPVEGNHRLARDEPHRRPGGGQQREAVTPREYGEGQEDRKGDGSSHRPLHTHVIDMIAKLQQARGAKQAGYAMAGLLVGLAVMAILLSVALPVWSHAAKREREAELIFRGEQYARAIELYQRQYVGAYPPDLDTLVDQRFLRRLYTDPMTEDGEFRPVYQSQVADLQGGPATADRPGETTVSEPVASASRLSQTDREEGGIVGVVSASEEESVRIYNGQQQYNEWAFVYTPSSTQPGGVAGSDDPSSSRRGTAGQSTDRDRFSFGGGVTGGQGGLRGTGGAGTGARRTAPPQRR